MKIIQNSDTQLVLKEGNTTSVVVGGLLLLVGLGVSVAGLVNGKPVPLSLIGIAVAVIGGLVAVFAKSVDVVADKTGRSLSVTFKSLKNRTGTTQTATFDQIIEVQLLQQLETSNTGGTSMNNGGGGLSFGTGGIGTGGDSQTTIQMNLAIALRDGSVWTLANEQRSAGLSIGVSQGGSLVGVGQTLADVLGVPFQQTGATSATQLVGAIVDHLRGGQQPAPSVVPVVPASQPASVSSVQPANVAPAMPLGPVAAAPAQPQSQSMSMASPAPAATTSVSPPPTSSEGQPSPSQQL